MTKRISMWHLPPEWHGLNRVEPQRVMPSQVEKESERNTSEKKDDRKGLNDSKEGKSDGTRRVPARHCFTSHCTEEENLSYASAFHIAFTIYALTRIMQLDSSVEKTLINLILFVAPSPSLKCSQSVFFAIQPLRSHSPNSYAKVFSSRPSFHVQYLQYSAELRGLVNKIWKN